MLIVLGQFFLCLSILIVLHEAGHFFAARAFNTRVEKFYLFFNPWFSLFKKKIGDTTYGIGWLPLGGYVKISGMIDESMDQEQLNKPAESWEFRSKPKWQKLIIMLGGVVVNFVLAFVIYVFMFGYWGEKQQEQNPLVVYSEVVNLEEYPLKSGDEILSINNKNTQNMCWRDVKMDNKKGYKLSRFSEGLKIIQQLRDEAHRFSLKLHRNKRLKSFISSELDNIPGIGEKNKKVLLNKFNSVVNIKKQSLNNLIKIIGKDKAKRVYNYFNK